MANATLILAENATSQLVTTATPAIQSTIGNAPAWLQAITSSIRSIITSILPGKEWLVVLGISALLAGLVVKKLREGMISLTALWIGGTIVVYLALKYAGL